MLCVTIFMSHYLPHLDYLFFKRLNTVLLNWSRVVNERPTGQKNLHQKFVMKKAPMMLMGRMYHCTPIPWSENIMANGS